MEHLFQRTLYSISCSWYVADSNETLPKCFQYRLKDYGNLINIKVRTAPRPYAGIYHKSSKVHRNNKFPQRNLFITKVICWLSGFDAINLSDKCQALENGESGKLQVQRHSSWLWLYIEIRGAPPASIADRSITNWVNSRIQRNGRLEERTRPPVGHWILVIQWWKL